MTRSKVHYTPQTLRRLNCEVSKMMEEERDCIDIITQLTAVFQC